MSGEKTIELTIAVPQSPDLAMVIYGPEDVMSSLSSGFCCDNTFYDVPKEPGVYKCQVKHRWSQFGPDDDYDEDFTVTATEKVI